MQERLYLIMYRQKKILLPNVDSKLFELPCVTVLPTEKQQ